MENKIQMPEFVFSRTDETCRQELKKRKKESEATELNVDTEIKFQQTNKFTVAKMKGLEGPMVIVPNRHFDHRGYFAETFNEMDYKEILPNVHFVQDNESVSKKDVWRGLHFQTGKFEQAKLVRVTHGSVVDFAIDIRKDSKTYGYGIYVVLSEINHRQLYIPRGFAHGFIALEDNTKLQYKCDNVYNNDSEGSFHFEPKDFKLFPMHYVGFDIYKNGFKFVSEKDSSAPSFKSVNNNLGLEQDE